MVVRSVLVVFSLIATSFVLSVPSATACHETSIGCLQACLDNERHQGITYDETENECTDTEHAIGVVQGVTVYGEALLDSSKNADVMGMDHDDTRRGTVEFRFEWQDTARAPVAITIRVDGHVDYESGNTGNLTFTASDTEQTVTFAFTVDGGHRHIPFQVRGNAAGQAEESIEGVFTVPADEDRQPGFWSKEVAGRYWYWLVLIALLAAIIGWLLKKGGTTVAPARAPVPPLAG